MTKKIAAIIDNAAFDLRRESSEYTRWPRDASKRRRIALAKAQKIMEFIQTSDFVNIDGSKLYKPGDGQS